MMPVSSHGPRPMRPVASHDPEPIIVEIDGIGELEFPGDTDPLVIQATVRALTSSPPTAGATPVRQWTGLQGAIEPTPPTAPAEKGWFDRATGPEDFPVYNLAKGAWNVVTEIPAGVKQLVTDPVGSVQMMGEAQGRLGVESKEAFDQGDYVKAVRKGVNYLLPVVGPLIDPSADKMLDGKVMEGTGEVLTNALLLGTPFAPKGAKTRPPRMAGPANPKEAAAVAFAKQEGIPLDAATATGNPFLRKVQKKVESSYGGSGAADELRTAQADHLARVGSEQAAKAGPHATNPVAAGESVRNALTKRVQDLHVKAEGSYNVIRAMEQAYEKALPKDAATRSRMDVTQRTPLAVDITEAVKELQPLYTKLKRESELGIPMQGAKGRTLAALDGLMNSPMVASLSVVDGALSDLKAMARGADMPELRSSGQASAAHAVTKLDAHVRMAAAKAGPNVLKALEEGRAATRHKYAVADVMDLLSGEPGQVFRQLTQSKDVGLARLKAVEKFAPRELQNVGRAFLEDAIQHATSEGRFMHTDRLWANWQKLGGETKGKLFSKRQIQDLDNFFLIAKRIKENPNPSGTATIPRLTVAEALAGIPALALSRMLLTPQGVKFLTSARVAGHFSSPLTRTFALGQLSRAAQSAGVPMDAIPALAESPEAARPKAQRR